MHLFFILFHISQINFYTLFIIAFHFSKISKDLFLIQIYETYWWTKQKYKILNILKRSKMFAFLQKKIAVPAQSTAYSCAWDFYEGWLAIGASEGFLKLLKLDTNRNKQ